MNRNVLASFAVLCLLSTVFLIGLAFNIQPVRAVGTIYIRADGSIDPPTANITSPDNITYTFTDNIKMSHYGVGWGIVVERNNIVVDGAGYTFEGLKLGYTYVDYGIYLKGRTNVTIRNMGIKVFGAGIYLSGSSYNSIFGNNITNNNEYGIQLYESPHNSISENIITNSAWGIELADSDSNNITIYGNTISKNRMHGVDIEYSSNNNISQNIITNNDYCGIDITLSDNNIIFRNNITDNRVCGIDLQSSSNNIIFRNNIKNNGEDLGSGYNPAGICLVFSSNNKIYHNNFIDNFHQVLTQPYLNFWDNGYPSGGNYWSHYAGTDANGDGIGDIPYVIQTNNQDNYPLMKPWTAPGHELVASIMAPASLHLGNSSSLNATVTNEGSSNVANVELMLLINGSTADSTIIPLLQSGDSYTLIYLWTPTVEGTYSVTAYAHPVSGETSTENNQMSKFATVSAPTTPPQVEVEVGVKTGDWIKCDYTVTGWPSGTPYPKWLKVEILDVEETTATVEVTMYMSNGTEQSDTLSVDVVVGGGGTVDTLFGFVIPAGCSTGDSITMGGDGLTFDVTMDGETTRTYAGASRPVVYASFSQYGTQLTYYWDQQTGILVEASTTSGDITGIAKVTETNMWEAAPFWMQWWLWAIVAIAVVALGGAVYASRKRKAPATPVPSPENTDQSK